MFCIKCGIELPEEAIFCSKCGTKIKTANKGSHSQKEKGNNIPGDILKSASDIERVLKIKSTEIKPYSIEEFVNVYQIVTSVRHISKIAEQFRNKTYPLNENEAINKLFGGCFSIGYDLRMAELAFQKVQKFDITHIKHKKDIKMIINQDIASHLKVEEFIKLIDKNNEYMGLSKDISEYSVIGIDDSQKILHFMINDFIESIKDIFTSSAMNIETYAEIFIGNAAMGYNYKLGEEIFFS